MAIETDHNTEILELELSYQKRRKERKEVFNFKNQECQAVFHDLTSLTSDLTGCFKDNANFKDQANRWHKTLKGMFHQAFRKIRVTENKPKPDEIGILMEQRKQLKVEIARCKMSG